MCRVTTFSRGIPTVAAQGSKRERDSYPYCTAIRDQPCGLARCAPAGCGCGRTDPLLLARRAHSKRQGWAVRGTEMRKERTETIPYHTYIVFNLCSLAHSLTSTSGVLRGASLSSVRPFAPPCQSRSVRLGSGATSTLLRYSPCTHVACTCTCTCTPLFKNVGTLRCTLKTRSGLAREVLGTSKSESRTKITSRKHLLTFPYHFRTPE